jgi:hypothetical protein
MPSYEREVIESDLTRIITDMISDWDTEFSGAVSGETQLLGDLNFTSIDMAMLVGEIHRFYQRRNIPFERVFLSGGLPVKDIQISALVEFLHEYLNKT